MRDVNGSNFVLLADPGDWTVEQGVAWNGHAYALAGKQSWRLPATMTRANALAALAATSPMVVDGFGSVARIASNGLTIESLDGRNWVPLTDIDGTNLAPKVGRFVAMALGGARLALLASDGTNSFLELFDLRGRWGLDSPENPAVAVAARSDRFGRGGGAGRPDPCSRTGRARNLRGRSDPGIRRDQRHPLRTDRCQPEPAATGPSDRQPPRRRRDRDGESMRPAWPSSATREPRRKRWPCSTVRAARGAPSW